MTLSEARKHLDDFQTDIDYQEDFRGDLSYAIDAALECIDTVQVLAEQLKEAKDKKEAAFDMIKTLRICNSHPQAAGLYCRDCPYYAKCGMPGKSSGKVGLEAADIIETLLNELNKAGATLLIADVEENDGKKY